VKLPSSVNKGLTDEHTTELKVDDGNAFVRGKTKCSST
jgi:hypothetical protein